MVQSTIMSFHTKDHGADHCHCSHIQQQLVAEVHTMLAKVCYDHSMETVLEHILQCARALLQADAAAIFRLRKKEGMLHIQAAQGISEAYATSMRVPMGKGVVGRAIVEQTTIALSNEELALPLDDTTDLSTQQRRLLEGLFSCFHTLLAIPLITNHDVYGGIVLYYNFPCKFTENTHRLAQTFGDQAAFLIENARIFNEAKNQVAQKERLRMARDLHDSVIQALYGITLYTEASLRLLSVGDREITSSYLYEIQETARETLQEMRLLVFELRPPILEQEGIVSALQARLDAVENRSQTVTSLQIEGDINLPHQAEEAFYRIALEALNNILKHARAHTIAIKLSQKGHNVQLEITDDGVGFNLHEVRKKGGAGLLGIEERIAHIGGIVTISSVPENGTSIKASLEI